MPDPELTPMLRQYYDLKAEAGDAILFFRMGDFYELFGDDALEIAPRLDLTLAAREKGDASKVPFCGVPHRSAQPYWLRLLDMGYRVAIADQMEEPSPNKKIVARAIVRCLTPGCIDELEGLEAKAPNYLGALTEDPDTKSWLVAIAEVSTGEFRLGQVQALADAVQHLERFRPREVVTRRFLRRRVQEALEARANLRHTLISELPEDPLRDASAAAHTCRAVLGSDALAAQPCGAVPGGETLFAAVLGYLDSLKLEANRFLAIRPLVDAQCMTLDETAVRDLELFETARRRERRGSLVAEIDRTLTPMGARLLRAYLMAPSTDPQTIEARRSAGRTLRQNATVRGHLRQLLKGLPDLTRLAGRLVGGQIRPQELAAMRYGLHQACLVADVLAKFDADARAPWQGLAALLEKAREPGEVLQRALADEPNSLQTAPQGEGLFQRGWDATLDELVALAGGGQEEIDAYTQRLRSRTGISSLRIKPHKTYGLVIEVTKANLGRVPDDFIRRQTMVNGERFVTEELRTLDERLAAAQERAIDREAELFPELVQRLQAHHAAVVQIAESLARLDVLQSFAEKAEEAGYAECLLRPDGDIMLEHSRHPVVEQMVGRHAFVPNTIRISHDRRHMLITGPNMAGKSTIMRQVGLAAILNQIGAFVPATSAHLPVFDRVFTRVGAADDLARGHSTFMVEMIEAANIMRFATPRSLVILDEVGRGTSTQDGRALASAILADLSQRAQPYTLFATHYHEIVGLAESLPGVEVMQIEVVEDGEEMSFTHRLVPGHCTSSYGLEVARLAGIPASVIAAARSYLAAETGGADVGDAAGSAQLEEAAGIDADASVGREVLEALRRLNINRTTPLRALQLVSEWQEWALQGRRAPPEMFPMHSVHSREARGTSP